MAATAVALFFVARSSRLAGIERVRADVATEQASVASAAYHASRDSIPVLQRAAQKANSAVVRARETARAVARTADSVTAQSRALLEANRPESPDSSYRTQLVLQVAVTDSLSVAFRAYVSADEQSHLAMTAVAERQQTVIRLADSALVAKDRVIAALRKAECKVLWTPCPTRTQAFVGGGLVVAAIFLGAR